ncbi:MAG: hypothetical protein Q9161_004746 [Pseudevernia consocians]
MHLHRRVAASLSFIVLSCLTSSAPTQSAFSNRPDASNDLALALPHLSNSSIGPAVAPRVNTSDSNIESGSSPTNLSTKVRYWTVTWSISDTLSLKINVGAWVLSPAKILQTLEAAQVAAGKKQAAALLDGKFTQETGSRINTMIFEIGPGSSDDRRRRLTWADVGDVLGDENGLPKFFRETQEWHSAYFDVVDGVRGKLGIGAVRKWYMLGSLDDTRD